MPLPPSHKQPSVPDVIDTAHKPDWGALRLLNHYRMLIILSLAAVFYLAEGQLTIGSQYPNLFGVVHLAYFVTTLGFVYQSHVRHLALNTQFYLQHYLDILFLCMLMYASGGISSGLGPLLLINLALLSALTSARHAFVFAAIGSVCILGGELLASLLPPGRDANFEGAALLGALLFLVAWLMSVPLRRLQARQMIRSTNSRATLDVQQIAQMNEDIIREFDSGILLVDSAGHVQVMNDTARLLLNAEFDHLPLPLRSLSAELISNLKDSERSPTQQACAFTVDSTGVELLPKYTRLASGGLLVRLDDNTQIRQQYQHLKLASLGRLSASIAHEIRNPLGAIANAVQLVKESDSLNIEDVELLCIAERNTKRINRIVDDVLQLSNRDRVQANSLDLQLIIGEFVERFRQEHGLTAQQLTASVEPCTIIADAGHLDQVLWNLCVNATVHNAGIEEGIALHIHIDCYDTGDGYTVLEVTDNGKGISDFDKANLFEPFFSTHHSGTGLGLYIIRELCELNKAELDLVASETGARFRVTWISAQDMAA